jgi:hypothetical protein
VQPRAQKNTPADILRQNRHTILQLGDHLLGIDQFRFFCFWDKGYAIAAANYLNNVPLVVSILTRRFHSRIRPASAAGLYSDTGISLFIPWPIKRRHADANMRFHFFSPPMLQICPRQVDRDA